MTVTLQARDTSMFKQIFPIPECKVAVDFRPTEISNDFSGRFSVVAGAPDVGGVLCSHLDYAYPYCLPAFVNDFVASENWSELSCRPLNNQQSQIQKELT